MADAGGSSPQSASTMLSARDRPAACHREHGQHEPRLGTAEVDRLVVDA